MAEFKIFKTTTSTMRCRGGQNNCIAIPKSSYRPFDRRIPKGTKVLSISVYGAGGGETAYYCEACMLAQLQKMQELINSTQSSPEEPKEDDDDHGASYYEEPPYGCGGY